MTRDEIKALIESKGLEANVRMQGDQKSWKITTKVSFEIPTKDTSSAMVLAGLESHLKRFQRFLTTLQG